MSVIPAPWEAEMDGSPELRSSRPAWPSWQNHISTKNTKISWVWWHTAVVLATWEAEAGESLEPRGGGYSELRLHHCTPAWVTEWECVSKKNKNQNQDTRQTGGKRLLFKLQASVSFGFFQEEAKSLLSKWIPSFSRGGYRVLSTGSSNLGSPANKVYYSFNIENVCGRN